MKTIFKQLPKRLVAAVTALVLTVGVASTAFAAFGPDRPTKVWSPNVEAFDYVTFNSFTNVGNGIGDERDFMRGVQVGRDSVWSDPVNNVSQGAEIEAKIYIHNGAKPSLNDAPGNPGIARNVNVRVALPAGSKQSHEMTSYISASNAQPRTVFDTLTMNGANNGFFELEIVPNSAKLHKNGTATAIDTNALVSANGVTIPDIPGCFEYVQEVTFRVKVKMPHFTVAKQVGIPGTASTEWKETVDRKQGETVSWLITFKNVGATQLKNVKIVDEVPAGLTVVPGSVKLTNMSNPNGFTYSDNAIQANGRQINVDIGTYNPNSTGYVSFRTTVNKGEGQAACSAKSLTNKAFATPEGYGAVFDTAGVNVAAEKCETPPQPPTTTTTTTTLPDTGAGDVIGIVTATTVAGALAHRYMYGRKFNI